MANTTLVVTSGEETVNFKLVFEDGSEKFIANANHDDHGWHAMEAIGNALESMAEELGIDIQHRSEYDEVDPDPLGD